MTPALPVSLLVILFLVTVVREAFSYYIFPSSELDALQAIYNATDGPDWIWELDDGGYPWNFAAVNDTYNPCTGHWEGIICSSDCQKSPCSIMYFVLYNTNLNGQLPDVFDALPNVLSLGFEELPFLIGPIPPSLCKMSNLIYLTLTGNSLSGSIPSCFGDLSSLRLAYIARVPLHGTIPTSISRMKDLSTLMIKGTYIGGHIPPIFNQMNCGALLLYYNLLTGTIPQQMMYNMTNATYISFASNFLVGSIPDDIFDPPILNTLDLSSNYISGPIPSTISRAQSLSTLLLQSNCLESSIPDELGNVSTLNSLRLDNNYLTGTIPSEFCRLPNLQLLYLFANYFTGTLPYYFFDMPAMKDVLISFNGFYGTLPPYANAPLLEGLDMALNAFSGELVTFEALPSLTVLLVSGNYFSGTLPGTAEQFVSGLLYLNCSTNMLTGELPTNLVYLNNMEIFDISNNFLSGSSPAMFHNWTMVYNIYLSANLFVGRADDLFDITRQVKLGLIDISTNGFTGSLPTEWFQLPNLHSFAAGQNCFTGSIPASICSCRNLTFLILDGLHSSSLCRHDLFGTYIPGLSNSARNIYYLSSAITDGIPSCIFNMSALQTLHASGNGIRGSLPSDLMIGGQLRDLSLSHNDFEGRIPLSILSHTWENLDVSFNKLQGTVSPRLQVTNQLNMQVNRLSGSIPSTMLTVPDLSMLSGNMFACRLDGRDLPAQDPSYRTYTCGSDEVNIALGVWLCSFAAVVLVVALQFCRLHRQQLQKQQHDDEEGAVSGGGASVEATAPDMTAQSLWDNAWKWTAMTGIHRVTWRIRARRPFDHRSSSTTSTDRTAPSTSSSSSQSSSTSTRSFSALVAKTVAVAGPATNEFAGGDLSKANFIAKFVYIMGRFHRYLLIVLGLTTFVLMPVYAILTVSFGTYTFQYAWTLSFCFLTGTEPAVTVFLLLLGLLVVSMLLLRSHSLLHHHPQPTAAETSSTATGTAEASAASGAWSTIAHEDQQQTAAAVTLSWRMRWNTVIAPVLIYAAIAVVNVVVVLSVNAAYVFSVGSFSFFTVFAVTLLVSAFKLVWNNVVVISLIGQYTQHLLRVPVTLAPPGASPSSAASAAATRPSFAASSGNFLFLLGLPLFNNIFAPYLAEAFVSSNCFLYAITAPDPVTSTITNSWGCEVDDDFDVNGSRVIKTNCGPNIVVPPRSDVLGFSNVSSLTYNPPFLYSYQCSSSLITAFAFVFAYRYIFTGIVQPLLYLLLKYSQERWFRRLQRRRRVEAAAAANTAAAKAAAADGDTTPSSSSSRWLHWSTSLRTLLVPPLARFLLPPPIAAAAEATVGANDDSDGSLLPEAAAYHRDALQYNEVVADLLLAKSASLASYFPAYFTAATAAAAPTDGDGDGDEAEPIFVDDATFAKDVAVEATAATDDSDDSDDDDADGATMGPAQGPRPTVHGRHRPRSHRTRNMTITEDGNAIASSTGAAQTTAAAAARSDPYKFSRAGFIGKAFVLRMISDLTVLLTFGVVFPPLAPLIVWSMLVDSYLVLVSLGRYLDVLLRSMAYLARLRTAGRRDAALFAALWPSSASPSATTAVASSWWRLSAVEARLSSAVMRPSEAFALARPSTVGRDSSLSSRPTAGDDDGDSDEAAATATAAAAVAAAAGSVRTLWSLWRVLNDAFRTFRRDLRRGIDISFASAAVFWSFSLLDTVGNSARSEEPKLLAFVLLVVMGTAPFWLTPLLRILLPLVLSAWPASSSSSSAAAAAARRAPAATSAGPAAPRDTFTDAAGDFGDVEMRASSSSPPRVDVQSPIHSAAHH